MAGGPISASSGLGTRSASPTSLCPPAVAALAIIALVLVVLPLGGITAPPAGPGSTAAASGADRRRHPVADQ